MRLHFALLAVPAVRRERQELPPLREPPLLRELLLPLELPVQAPAVEEEQCLPHSHQREVPQPDT